MHLHVGLQVTAVFEHLKVRHLSMGAGDIAGRWLRWPYTGSSGKVEGEHVGQNGEERQRHAHPEDPGMMNWLRTWSIRAFVGRVMVG